MREILAVIIQGVVYILYVLGCLILLIFLVWVIVLIMSGLGYI